MTDQQNMKEEGTITLKKSTIWKIATFLFLGLLIASIFTGGFGRGSSSVTGAAVVNNQPPTNPTTPNGIANVNANDLADDDPFLGEEDAPLTIIEFSDYQCPFCRRFWTQTLGKIKSQYIDTGKVKFVYRDFPLSSIHPAAQPAAEAAECVRDQGGNDAYFEMHDKIFEEQSKQGQGTVQFGVSELKQWADDLGYDIGKCLDSGKFRNEVSKDLQDATASGGRGTPYFIVGSTPLSGAQPFSSFQAVIEAELSQ